MANPWEMDWTQPPVAPQFPGVIQGRPPTPDPVDPTIQTGRELDNIRKQQEIEEANRKKAEQEAKQAAMANQADAVAKLTRVIEQIDRVYADSGDNEGWFETGATGQLMRGTGISGTAAYDLAAALKAIDANMAFDALQRMRESSPTGGALGQVTERELDLLKSTVASLDPDQSQDQFIRALGTAKGAYLDMLRRIDPAKAEEIETRGNPQFDAQGNITYDERAREAAAGLNPPSDGGGGSFNGVLQRLGEGTSSMVKGMAALPGLAIDPFGQLMYNALGYDQRYNTGEILSNAIGLPDNPIEANDAVIQGASAALTGGLVARAAAPLAAPGSVTQNVLATVGRTPIRDTASGAGAGAGMVAGERSGVPGGQVAGALLGGMAGYGAASGTGRVNALLQGGDMNALGQASARQGVNLLPADAGGDATRILTSGAKASPLSAGPIRTAARGNQAQMKAATQRAVGERPEGLTTDKAGQSVRDAATRYASNTSDRGERLYTRAYKLAEGVRAIKPLRTLARLDEEIARLRQNPAASDSAIQELASFREKIAGGVSVRGLRDARTLLSQGVYDGRLRSGAEKGMWKKILGEIADDIDAGLREAGKDNAADAFQAADSFWERRVRHIDDVLQPIVSASKGGEEIIGTIERMARGQAGGNARLSRLLAEMTPEEAQGVRGTIIDRLGKATPGQQDATGEVFAPSTFLTNWNRLTPQAKASLFGDTKLRNDLNDLALLAENMKASQAMANHSNTAMALTGGGQAIGAYAIAAATHPVIALLAGGAQVGLGKLLASPGFARLLTRTAKMPPEVASRRISEQLGIIAGRQPLVANDARAVQQYLSETFSATPQRAAAEEENR